MKKIMILALAILVIMNIALMSMLSGKHQDEIQNEVIINQVEVSGYSTDITKIIEESQDKLVIVKQNLFENSGFIYQVDEEVIIVTTLNNIDLNIPLNVIFNNDQTVSASVLGYDEKTNILVLKATPDFKVNAFNLSNSDLLKQGELVVSLGSTLRIGRSGYVSIGYMEEIGLYDETSYVMKADILVNSQNIGGPIINMAGDVIGINNAFVSNTLISPSFVPINTLKWMVDNIIENKTITYHELGFQILDISTLTSYQKASLGIDLTKENGLYIYAVTGASIASEIGFVEGMMLESINDVEVTTIQEYHQQIHQTHDELIFKGHLQDEAFELEWTIND